MNNTPTSIRPLGFALFALCANATFAIQYDLVSNSSQIIMGSIPSGVIFDKGSLQTSGTGAIDPFLRLHHGGTANFEKGFNTSSPDNPPDGFSAINGSFTHDLLLSTLATVTRNGVDYYQFNLDL